MVRLGVCKKKCVDCAVHSTSVFRGLGEPQLKVVSDQKNILLNIEEGRVVLEASELAHQSHFCLGRGRAEVIVNIFGREVKLRDLYPGEFFSLSMLYQNLKLPLKIRAKELTSVCLFSQALLSELADPLLYKNMMMCFMKYWSHSLTHEIMVYLPRASERFVYWVRSHLSADWLSVHRTQVAKSVGMRKETFSRMISCFVREGVLEKHKNNLRVRDAKKLKEIMAAEDPLKQIEMRSRDS